MPDYHSIDHSSMLSYVFYPREETSTCPRWGFDHFVTISDEIILHCRFYKEDNSKPWVLFFHGNGEVVGDYDEISLLYLKEQINLVVADYRGYGKSTGTPTLSDMISDALIVYNSVRKELSVRGLQDKLWIMGRSLGSVCALEIASRMGEQIPAIIIESGFSSIARLLMRLHGPATEIDLEEIDNQSIPFTKKIVIPALLIHGEYDTLVPLDEAEILLDRLGSHDKELLVVPGASHNDILFLGLTQYMGAIRSLVQKTT